MAADISVVIPTHNRAAGLARLLAALGRQSIGVHRFEVIVVDDGSPVPVAITEGRLRLRVVRHDHPHGPAAARNSGWRAAQAPIIAFIDDDCVADENWLEGMLQAAGGEEVVIQGRIAPLPDQREQLHPLSHTIEVGGLSQLFVSANIAYPRLLLERLAGFDERFTRACGEDAELGARAMRAGARARFAPEALVYHEVRQMTLLGHIRHTLKWTEAVRAVAMHPELRAILTARLFWKPTHPWLIAAAAALIARRPLLAALAAMPYLAHYRRIYRGDPEGLARAMPTHLVIDACEIGTALAGSVQHRTLML